MSQLYLNRYAWPSPVLNDYRTYSDIGYVVVIPVFNEPDIQKALAALNNASPPEKQVLVLVVVNEPEGSPKSIVDANQKTLREVRNFRGWFQLQAVHSVLPKKKAGVGLARKVGMDEAIRIFESHGTDGIIICFDADCGCSGNYFLSIENYYYSRKQNLGLVYYEHPLDSDNSLAITHYELFLRHYIDGLRYARFPYACHTLGSCITVRSSAYQKQGGMNTRKAGEDFYFIHKMMPIGGIGEINHTCVYPADRISDRVPFGTGHAIGKFNGQEGNVAGFYAPQIFEDLRCVFTTCFRYYSQEPLTLPESVLAFYEETNFNRYLIKILEQSNNQKNFYKRFFAWWDAFRVLKFTHFARDNFYPNVPPDESVGWLGEKYFNKDLTAFNLKDQLLFIRQADRGSSFRVGDINLLHPKEDKR